MTMKYDRLTQLIQQADKDLGPPVHGTVDVSKIRRQMQRRKRLRVFNSIAAVMIVGLTLVLLTRPPSIPSEPSVALAQIGMQTEVLYAMIHRRCEAEQKNDLLRRRYERVAQLEAGLAAVPDPLQQVRAEVDKAARTMVTSADRMSLEPGLRRQAVRDYERVIRLFPDNTWAQVARNRLARMKDEEHIQKGELL